MSRLERIMHIEDDDSIREVVRVALEVIGGFTVMSCSSGAEGLASLPAFAPQLILLDVMMPGMDGPQTLLKLREIPGQQGIPVIFMTAKVQPQEVDDYLLLGAASVIIKPFDPMTLADQVHKVWNHTYGQN